MVTQVIYAPQYYTQHPESELTTSLNKNIINCHHIHCATNLIN